jgi:hypothetical protein
LSDARGARYLTETLVIYMLDTMMVFIGKILRFEVLMAQPLPKLATTVTRVLHTYLTPYFPTEFKYYRKKLMDY